MTYDAAFYDVIANGCRLSAQAVVPALVGLFDPQTVLDVGCGEGHWLAEFKRHGCEVVGLDGPHVQRDRLAIDPAEFVAVDLAHPPVPGRRFDLALSLEVGEHLPPESARYYVASLVASAPVVVFSAAIPGQGGNGHVNEQWPGYWASLFREQLYVGTGALRWAFWNDPRVEVWYRQNLLVFARSDEAGGAGVSAEAKRLWTGRCSGVDPVVHPALWDARRL